MPIDVTKLTRCPGMKPNLVGPRGRVSATANLRPRQVGLKFVTRLQGGKTFLKKLQAVNHICVAVDIDQHASQPAPL